MPISKILDKIRNADPPQKNVGVFWEDIDTLFKLAFAEKDQTKRAYLDDLIHMLSLLSDIELLKVEKRKHGGEAAPYSIGLKVDEFREMRSKILKDEVPKIEVAVFDPNKHKLVQDTLF